MAVPSSSSSTGILPSGFCRRTLSDGSTVSAGSILMSPSSPRTAAAMRTLRTNGDGVAERRIIRTTKVRGKKNTSAPMALMQRKSRNVWPRSAGDNEVDRLGSLAFLVGLDVEADALPFVERLEPGALHRGDVHEHVASTIVGFDEAVAPLAVEELDGPAHCHWEAPFPNIPPRRPMWRGGSAGHSQSGKGIGRKRASVTSAGPHREAERQSQPLQGVN